MFVQAEQANITSAGQGAQRKMLGAGGSLMMVEVTFEKGAVGEVHSHPHEQVSYIVQGSFRFQLGDEEQVVKKGDSVYIPSGVRHGVVALEEESVILDVFTPQREDFLTT
ncbi:cupin domain-containing protein [Brevibacillus fulvus]|uniref:Quercetin dioxygenase-like cupin family protein n=1 Tax=Brevibacillus fulvus TaxID=1125967 RepID=A0A939BTE3_9BACL|nr:cupin domain-containing protein [Brevibacillus fulvus]MBM7591737.1 quercetin dioxygenase-like cupin family protein [Brevibacillus fulvus]